MQLILRATGAHEYVDRSTVNRISGVATDFLIVAGMESIKFSVVVKYAVPLTILFVFGFLLNWFWFMRFGMNMARENSFERNIFVWGAANEPSRWYIASPCGRSRVQISNFRRRGHGISGKPPNCHCVDRFPSHYDMQWHGRTFYLDLHRRLHSFVVGRPHFQMVESRCFAHS